MARKTYGNSIYPNGWPAAPARQKVFTMPMNHRQHTGLILCMTKKKKVTGGNGTRMYYTADGSSYISFPRLTLNVGDVITFLVKLPPTPSALPRTIVGSLGAGWSTSKIGHQNGLWAFSARFKNVTVNGLPVENGSPAVPGTVCKFKFSIPDVYTLRTVQGFGCYAPQSGGVGEFFEGVCADLKVTRAGVVIFNMPVNDGWSEDRTINETVSASTGTLVGGVEERWFENVPY